MNVVLTALAEKFHLRLIRKTKWNNIYYGDNEMTVVENRPTGDIRINSRSKLKSRSYQRRESQEQRCGPTRAESVFL